MWEAFSEMTPYYFLKNPQSIMKYVFYDDGRPNLKDIKNEVHQEILELIQINWHKDPKIRMEFKEIVPILTKYHNKI